MPFYHKMGTIPAKRHTVYRKPDGSLFREQVMGTKGFSGIQSILYHHYPPTGVIRTSPLGRRLPQYEEQGALLHRHFRTSLCAEGGDAVMGRRYVLGNDDLLIGVANATETMDYFYRNGDGDEVLYVQSGTGTIETMFGTLPYRKGDYIVLPIGTIYRVVPDAAAAPGEVDASRTAVGAGASDTAAAPGSGSRFLVVETNSWIATPKRYRNEHGQLLEHSPFCERDIRLPETLETHTDLGEFEIRTNSRGMLHAIVVDHHPFDVVGWDGYLYPWIFNIEDFEPITGRIHMPPPIHQTFEGHNFVICSFVPRLYDYHPQAIPAPYYHSNVDSDEVLFYSEGHFMSRNGIEAGSITLHPAGIPHGPHPGKAEASIGKRETSELAVMIDTFRPLKVVQAAWQWEDPDYAYSWAHK